MEGETTSISMDDALTIMKNSISYLLTNQKMELTQKLMREKEGRDALFGFIRAVEPLIPQMTLENIGILTNFVNVLRF